MTSEVVVMNSLGVALATDSAATVGSAAGDKVFNTADKLFMLSRRHPVGVMVYGNAALLGVPWETIIKMFRRQFDGNRYPRLEDYGQALIAFIDGNDKLFPLAIQDRSYLRLIEDVFGAMADRIDEEVFGRFLEQGQAGVDVAEIARAEIESVLSRWREGADSVSLAEGVGVRLASRFSGQIGERVAKAFGNYRIGSEATTMLYEIARLIVSKEKIPSFARSGIVVAGFGDDDHFPVVQQIEVGDIFESKLKHVHLRTLRIDADTPSVVEPFADAEMVNTFLHGMNPSFEIRMRREMAELATRLPDEVVDAITDLTDEQKEKWKKEFRPESVRAIKSLFSKLDEHREERHLLPIRQAVANMPKDELGHAAARLVSLNWFQKRMSLSTETVGGPVDVAVISKGDGFIWIDRKHYFRAELNPHYFNNHHTGLEHDGDHHAQTTNQAE